MFQGVMLSELFERQMVLISNRFESVKSHITLNMQMIELLEGAKTMENQLGAKLK
jgi:hypothetical protein